MQVYKLCMKIIKKNLPSMIIYVVVFVSLSLIVSLATVSEQKKDTSFSPVKRDMAFISEESSPLIDGLKTELGKIANFVELPDETEALQDALYFRSVNYILRVPKGFTESFMKGEEIQLKKTIVPNSVSNVYIDLSINKYFNTARLYVNHMGDITQESLAQHLKSDLSISTPVEVKTTTAKPSDQAYANYFFNYMSYTIMSVLILGMSTLMLVFNKPDVKRRNACSPFSTYKMNIEFILAILMFTFVTWLITIVLCLFINFKNSFNLNTVYFLINSLVFAICAASISYFIGSLVKSRNAVSAISNIASLGPCFISGVFVSQELLGDTVLKIASFTPTYWYVKANNQIAALTQFDFTHLKSILSYILIEIGFAVAFFAVALVIGKKKRFY